MLKIHLAQLNFNPAYFDPPVDFLEEPAFLNETDTPLGRLRIHESVKSLLSENRSQYIKHLENKISNILNWSENRNAHVIAFPEYSIPVQLLVSLSEFSKKHSLLIIAGSHRITSDEQAKAIYRKLNIPLESAPPGAACVPIFFPDGSARVALKLTRSKWEANLSVPSKDPEIHHFNHEGAAVRFAVVPCVDSLHAEVLGKLWASENTLPNLVVCPSLSPTTDIFHHTASLAASRDVLFAYVNAAPFGETFFQIPATWQPYLQGLGGNLETVPRYEEAVLELQIDPQKFYVKRGSIERAPVCSHPLAFPIVYTKDAKWLKAYDSFRNDVIEWLKDSELNYACDWIDSFLSEQTSNLPDLVVQGLKYLRHSVVPLYDGNIDSLKNELEIVRIPSVDDTRVLWARNVSNAIRILGEMLVASGNTSLDILLECLRSLKTAQNRLPELTSDTTQSAVVMPDRFTFTGADNLVEAFQNRGSDLDQVRSFFANTSNRVIIVTGSVGIGKSDFVNWMFKKAFVDWQLIRVNIPRGTSFARIVSDIAYSIGQNLDVDSLSSASSTVFRKKMRKLLTQFYALPKRVLVLDDLQHLLMEGSAADHRQVQIFLEEVSQLTSFVGGRIFLVSSSWLPNKWLFAKGVAHLHLKRLADVYIRRVIEYHMRRADNVSDETVPEPPQPLLDLINGHPLSARLAVDAVNGKDFRELSNDLMLSKITDHVAKELLSRVELTSDQMDIMQNLAVFRLPIMRNTLLAISEEKIGSAEVDSLLTRGLLSYDGHNLEMHEAVRRFYESRILDQGFRRSCHRFAASYYEKLYDDISPARRKDPTTMAELVHHLSLAGDIHRVKQLRLLIVSELKPTARQIYRQQHDYQRALSLYRLLAEITPDDPEVLAYVGRCFARVGQWNDSDAAFEKAIEIAEKTRKTSWWLYRDWGHIKARFQYYEEARELLLQAQTMNPTDASITGSLAYMLWRQGDETEAEDLFEEALELNPNNIYVLTFYPKLLDGIGDFDYANELRARLAYVEGAREYRAPSEYDLDEFDD